MFKLLLLFSLVLPLLSDDIERIERLTQEIVQLRHKEVMIKREFVEVIEPNRAMQEELEDLKAQKKQLLKELESAKKVEKKSSKTASVLKHSKKRVKKRHVNRAKTYDVRVGAQLYDAKAGNLLFELKKPLVITSDTQEGDWVKVTGMVISKKWRGTRGVSLWVSTNALKERK